MGASKIVNETEVLRWFREGKTYAWMQEQYRELYNVETSLSMWGNFRRSRNLEPRIVRDDDLIPWAVRPEHRHRGAVGMLRIESRLREGAKIPPDKRARLDSWKAKLAEADAVVHYDPDTEAGFHYVPRRPEDTDLIRRPKRKTGRRSAT